MSEREYNNETRVVETVHKVVVREHGKLIELWLEGNKTDVPDKVMFSRKGVLVVQKRVELNG